MHRPNILILYTDQQRWDAVGANGNRQIRTPNLDRLAADGVNFANCQVQNALCMPSRVSFLTGQYPSTLGITHMGVPVPPDTLTLPRMLRNAGYRSANFGKLHFLPHANRNWRNVYPDYGFDELEISDEPGCYEDAYRAWVRAVAPDQLDHISLGLPPSTEKWQQILNEKDSIHHFEGRTAFSSATCPFIGRDDVTHSAFLADRTIDFLQRQRGERPFMCIAGFFFPHAPWIVPERFLSMYDRSALSLPQYPPPVAAHRAEKLAQGDKTLTDENLRTARHGYYASVSEVDFHVGRILESLHARGLDEQTIVIFTSDHGEYLGDHLRWAKGPPGHDACLRVPLIARGPGISAGTNYVGLIEAVDVVPTLLEAAGMQVPPPVQGRSFLPILRGQDHPDRPSALCEHTGWRNLRTPRFRYITHASGQEMLFDLESDPGEYRNLADDPQFASALAEARAELIRRMIHAHRPLPRVWTY